MKTCGCVLLLLTVAVAGCGGEAGAEVEGITLCGDCGQVKGSELCCQEGAATCEKCGLAEGAPGCCKIEKGAAIVLCADCGQIEGTDLCCAADAEVCPECGWHKGSVACCKIPKPGFTPVAETVEAPADSATDDAT